MPSYRTLSTDIIPNWIMSSTGKANKNTNTSGGGVKMPDQLWLSSQKTMASFLAGRVFRVDTETSRKVGCWLWLILQLVFARLYCIRVAYTDTTGVCLFYFEASLFENLLRIVFKLEVDREIWNKIPMFIILSRQNFIVWFSFRRKLSRRISHLHFSLAIVYWLFVLSFVF